MVGPSAGRSTVLCFLTALAIVAHAQEVTVRASVDRPIVRENESFTYSVVAEGRVRGEPDASALEQQFEILNRSSSTRIQIANGQTQQVAEWVYELIPLGPGRFTLPPVELAGVRSNAVELEVLPTVASDDEPADIFMEVDAQPSKPYVQSQVLYTLRLFVGVSTGRATLTAPQVSGGEAIVERLGEDRQYQTTRGGRSFIVRERRYAIFPQETGALTIGPATFEAMVIPNRGFSRVQRLRSGSLELDVQAAVPPPPEFPDAVWLPARALTLSEEWVDEEGQFSLGVPRTRMLTIEADGVLETQLPEIPLNQAVGIRQYPDQPELDRRISEQGVRGRRVERYAVIAQDPGEVEIPGQELAWWNTEEERWESARIEPRVVSVLPGLEPAREPAPADAEPEPEPVPTAAPNYWRAVSAVLAVGWLATVLLWLRSGSAAKAPSAEQAPRARRASNRRLLRKLRTACEHNDAAAAHRFLLQWAELRFPEMAPQSLGVLAERLPPAAAAEVAGLEAHVYGVGSAQWNGQGLAAALKGIDSVAKESSDKVSDPLMPLYR